MLNIIKLFLSLFKFCLLYISSKKSNSLDFYIMHLENQHYRRFFKEHNLKPSFLPHEKQAIYECFNLDNTLSRIFSLVSPKTVLTVWKNAIAKFWTSKNRKSGRPPISKDVKELILNMKQDNFLWGARRIRDEL